MLGIDRHSLQPFRQAVDFTEILLKKRLALDAVGITSKNERAIVEERKDEVGHAVVVSKQIALGVAGLWKIDLVEIADAEALAVEFEESVFRAALEEFGFDLCLGRENFADDSGGLDNVRI